MRGKKVLVHIALAAMIVAAAAALMAPAASARPGIQPGCDQACKPFVRFGSLKCYFVGCSTDGVCRYIC